VRRGDPATAASTYVEHGYDGLGRRVLERRLMPDGTYARQLVRFDGQGRKVFESEWVGDGEASPPGTTWSDFDPWDRPQTVTYADHVSDDPASVGYRRTTTAYQGTRRVQITQSVGTGAGGAQSPGTTTQFFDSLGRLVLVDPPEGFQATYFYDVNDKLRWVVLDRGGPDQQLRTFHYDRTGRLRWEDQPESGHVDYRAYDPFGSPTVVVDARGLGLGYELHRDYDAAGRLLGLRKYLAGPPVTDMALAAYGYDQAGHGQALGMLTEARAWNEGGMLEFTRSLTYEGASGQLTREGTVLARWGATAPLLEVRYGHDALGQVSQVSYAREDASEPPEEQRPVTDLSLGYRHGLLDSITSAARGTILTGTDYNPAGSPAVLEAGNGVETWIDPDLRNRPSRVRFYRSASAVVAFDSGAYRYDGSSNLTAIGPDEYRYDLASRLVRASLANEMPAARTFDYSYDGFGNLLSKELDKGLAAEPVRTALRALFDVTGRTYAGNRITSPGFGYDPNGNQTQDPSGQSVWDTQNRMTVRAGTAGDLYVSAYDAGGYRVWRQEVSQAREVFYVRDGEGRVLSEFGRPASGSLEPHWLKDYVYAGERLVAVVENEEPLIPAGAYSELSPAGGTTVKLSWAANPEADLYGYRLYRSGTEGGFRTLEASATGSPVTDSMAGAGYYWLTAIDVAGNESEAAGPFWVQAGDVTAPPAVGAMSGYQEGVSPLSVRLSWSEVTSADLQGYDVFRKNPGQTQFGSAPVNGTVPVRGLTYLDVVPGIGSYTYKVLARDTAGNRSASWPQQTVFVAADWDCIPGFPCQEPWAWNWGQEEEVDWEEVFTAWMGRMAPGSLDETDWEAMAQAFRERARGRSWQAAGEAFREGDGQRSWETLKVSPPEVIGDHVEGDWRVVWVHADHLGSVRMTSLANQTIVSRHTYEPFGWEVPRGFLSSNTHRFTGHERDATTGLDYMLARYYASNQARFLSVDPVLGTPDRPQSWNRYAYARNAPLRFIDPTGLSDEEGLRTMKSLKDPDVQAELAKAMETAGYDAQSPSSTREVVGGIGETVEGGHLSGDFVAVSIARPDATPSQSTPMDTGEIAQSTGGSPVAGFHTHQLAGRIAAPEKKQGVTPSSEDQNTAREFSRPELVVSRQAVHMAWTNDKGKIKTGKVMSYDSVDALKFGNVTMHTPRPLRDKTP
jgi:RHS repeat-associated protein